MDHLFKIFKVDPIESKKIQNALNEPHQHDFEELLIGRLGKLEHFIDFESKLMDAPFISFVTQGKMHRVRPLPDDHQQCDIWVLRFKSEFIPETTFQLYSMFHNNANLCMQTTSCFERLNTVCEIIFQEYQQSQPDMSVIRQLLSTLFTFIESERKKQHFTNADVHTSQNVTFKNFLQLLEENYKQPLGVNFYASKLFMTARNLNLISQNIMQQSITDLIETRKLIEAKNLLIANELSIAEIGYELGYKEKTYFTHAFKRKSGITPSDFRKEMTRIIS